MQSSMARELQPGLPRFIFQAQPIALYTSLAGERPAKKNIFSFNDMKRHL
ncbi:hypothetical protein PAMC26577_14090 [Caballeronia sordidicola]|uniref:Uncharacterized protein n=1 Tax=Caballeronia sordidicola TaxID=196367 RepID=A0A242MUE5_CABSO|nr:hypothetical protein PAMC26577_14090 [Caballeronia sordidicola]